MIMPMKPFVRQENKGHRNILDYIGYTHLVPIIRINPHSNVTILAKLEMFNPGGSEKTGCGAWNHVF
jgi:cysteine synthase